MNDNDKKIAKDLAYKIIRQISRTIRPYVGKEESGVTVKIGADGTPTSLIDVIAEDTIINILKRSPIYSYVISEEIGEIKIGKGKVKSIVLSDELQREDLDDDEKAGFIFLIDPIDGTTNAVREIPAYAISIAVADVSYGRMSTLDDVELGFISNLANGSFFEAEKGKGCLLRNKEVRPSDVVDIGKMTLGGFIKTNTASASNLVDTARRMRVLGSVVLELSYVASGKYDAFLDLRGSRIIDIAASKLIVEEAGAVISDENGKALSTRLGISEKTVVVAASNMELHAKIIDILKSG